MPDPGFETREGCPHPAGLRAVAGSAYLCPHCGERLDLSGVARWVRQAERARDDSYPLVEGDGFAEIVYEERQREVYRRRRVMYELENASRGEAARPEMILVVYDAREGVYDCRVFYKEPRPVGGMENLRVPADLEAILELRSDPDPVVRLSSQKIEEFHAQREGFANEGAPPPERRVFYASEF